MFEGYGTRTILDFSYNPMFNWKYKWKVLLRFNFVYNKIIYIFFSQLIVIFVSNLWSNYSTYNYFRRIQLWTFHLQFSLKMLLLKRKVTLPLSFYFQKASNLCWKCVFKLYFKSKFVLIVNIHYNYIFFKVQLQFIYNIYNQNKK